MRKILFFLWLLFQGAAPAIADQRAPELEKLFNQLAAARSIQEANPLIMQIDAVWLQSGSDTIDLLFARAADASSAQELDIAVKLLNVVIELRPDFAEGWFHRALIYLQMDSQQEAAADLAKVVRLEPRHFRAHALMGTLSDNMGRREAALAAYRQALLLNPMMDAVRKRIEELSSVRKLPPPI